jgi:FkbH-like protein
MSFRIAQLPWRPPAPDDWGQRLDRLLSNVSSVVNDVAENASSVTADFGVELHVLANAQLGDLQRIKLGKCVKKLSPYRQHLAPLRSFRLLALSNRTLSWFNSELSIAAPARGLFLSVIEGGFDSATSVALNASTSEGQEAYDGVLLFFDHAAVVAPPRLLASEEEDACLKDAKNWLGNVAHSLRERYVAPVILATIPIPPEHVVSAAEGSVVGTSSRFITKLNEFIAEGGNTGDWIVWDVQELANQVGTQSWFDPIRFHQTKAPFAIELCPLVADHFCSVISAMCGKAGRALVLDLDNTLWGGVIADDGLDGIRVGQGSPEGEAYVDFQKSVLHLRDRGIVLAICSKNQDDIAREPFERHPDMLMKLEHISFFQANWADKATNLKAVAEGLNLGHESIVFVDDNPAERARIRQLLPLVKVPEMGEDPAFFRRILMASGYFRHLVLTKDDMQRLGAYTAMAERAKVTSQLGNYAEYLTSLQMRMTIARFDSIGRKRIVQLISKSNQFNLTTRRYNDVQIASMEEDSQVLAWQVRLSDKFGDHGMIAVVIVRKEGDRWIIDTWLMSCRVLERGVEQTIMNHLVARALKEGVKRIEGTFLRTDRNALVADFYPRMGFKEVSRQSDDSSISYLLDTHCFEGFKSTIDVELLDVRAANAAPQANR